MNRLTNWGVQAGCWKSCALIIVGTILCFSRVTRGQETKIPNTTRRAPAQATVAGPVTHTKVKMVPAHVKVGPPKSGPKTPNPFAAQKSSSILMQLDQQRRAADEELSKMKLGVRPAQTGTLLHPPNPNSGGASANGVRTNAPARMPAVQATPSTAPRASTGAITQASAPPTLLKPTGPGAIGPEGTTATRTVSSAIVRAPDPMNTLALTCANNPTMRILNVSGSYFPATFTTIKKFDSYTITGCSLGDPGSNAKVYLYKDVPQGSGFPLQFQILEWHDNWIHLQLDWNLSGLFDQDNLTLVVQRADGKQASKGGFKFYAAREESLLGRIPRQSFSLWGFSATNTSAWKVTYNSPASNTDGWGFQGMTAEVQWDEELPYMKSGFDTAHAPSGGRDVYDFSRLQPGFVPTNAYMQWQNVCYAGTLITTGKFGLSWQASQLWVDWQGQNCANVGCGGSFQPDCFAVPNSIYGLDVWVEGPRGIDPWTGLPTKH